jgi:tRNA 2-thiouridine synthesizing protein E
MTAADERATDAEGYLSDWTRWDEDFALAAAQALGLELRAEHWTVVRFLRDFYRDYAISPPMRVLVRSLATQLGDQRATSRRLYQLFPDGPARQACKIAGLPKPESCI